MGKIRKMIDYAVAIANDDSRGYSQTRRWPSQGTDFDCASLMYEAAYAAGYNVTVGPSGVHYTGTMIDDFRKAGFEVLEFDGNLYDLDPGDILVRDPWGEDGHTEMYIGNNQLVGALLSDDEDLGDLVLGGGHVNRGGAGGRRGSRGGGGSGPGVGLGSLGLGLGDLLLQDGDSCPPPRCHSHAWTGRT